MYPRIEDAGHYGPFHTIPFSVDRGLPKAQLLQFMRVNIYTSDLMAHVGQGHPGRKAYIPRSNNGYSHNPTPGKPLNQQGKV